MYDDIAECDNCGAHFRSTDSGDVQAGGCPDCGGDVRPYRSQPSPVQSPGTLRNMVDSDSQVDQGGNPLGEGTIVGSDGIQPPWKRDEYTHSALDGIAYKLAEEEHDPNLQGYPRELGVWDTVNQPNIPPVVGEDNYWQGTCPTCEGQGKLGLLKSCPACQGSGESTYNTRGGEHGWAGDGYYEPHHIEDAEFDERGPGMVNDLTWKGKRNFGADYDEAYEQQPHGNIPDMLIDHLEENQKIPTVDQQGWTKACPTCRAYELEGVTPGSLAENDILNRVENCPSCHGDTLHETPLRGIGSEGYEEPREVRPNYWPHGTDEWNQTLQAEAEKGNPTRKRNFGGGKTAARNYGSNLPVNHIAMRKDTFDTEPYDALFHERTAGPFAALGEIGLGDVAGALMKGALFQTGKQMLPGGGGGQGGGGIMGQLPNVQVEEQPATMASVTAKGYETPTSNPDVGAKHGDDPEKVDQKEFNDQDKSPENPNNPNNEDSGASGEDEVRDNAGFGPDSVGIQRMQMMLPLIMHYFHSPDAGESDPMIKSLHELLESENPGYLDHQHDPKHVQIFIEQLGKKPKGVHAADSPPKKVATIPLPGIPGGDPNDAHQYQQDTIEKGIQSPTQGLAPGTGGVCPSCGGVLSGNGSCPQCGQSMGSSPVVQSPHGFGSGLESFGSIPMILAANHQGPVTPEQISAVQELLHLEQRDEEVPLVPIKPEDFANEMAQIQQKQDVPPQIQPDEQTQPPQPQMAPPGGMPMPGMGGEPGGQPMQPMAAVEEEDYRPYYEDIADPKERAFHEKAEHEEKMARNPAYRETWEREHPDFHTGADTVAKRCPKCNSATTGMLMDEDNSQYCHACGNVWKDEGAHVDKSVNKESKVADSLVEPQQQENPVDAPAAERGGPTDVEKEEDSSLTWKDAAGQPLQPEHEYEMHNPSYELPDVIKVLRTKPDAIEVELKGTFSNEGEGGYHTHISKEDMEMHKITFTPIAAVSQEDRGNEPPPGQQAPGLPPAQPTTDEYDNQFPQNTSAVLAALVDSCPNCGDRAITSSMMTPEDTEHECFRCGHSWSTHEATEDFEASLATRAWVHDDSDDNFTENMERHAAMRAAGEAQSRDLGEIASKDERYQEIKGRLNENAKTAGRKFSPSEQKELIDEKGNARNKDLLDLKGTHYESSTGNAANAPDDHLLFI